MDRPVIELRVSTRHPEDYVLINELDKTRWRGTPAGSWRHEPISMDRPKMPEPDGGTVRVEYSGAIGMHQTYTPCWYKAKVDAYGDQCVEFGRASVVEKVRAFFDAEKQWLQQIEERFMIQRDLELYGKGPDNCRVKVAHRQIERLKEAEIKLRDARAALTDALGGGE